MKTAILTGFRPFGPYVVNPTGIVAETLDGGIISEHLIRSFVFPPTVLLLDGSVDYGYTIVEDALRVNASVIISLGMASEAKGVRIEGRCTNWVEGKYCTEFENGRPIFVDRPDREKRFLSMGRWDIMRLHRKLFVLDINCEISEDAGSYCCNAMMYRILRAMDDLNADIPYVFAHVPCTPEAVVGIPDFDPRKTLLRQADMISVVAALLKSYS